MRRPELLLLVLALLLSASALAAQEAAPAPAPGAAPPPPPPPAPRADPKLVFEREVFLYPGENRRDPFTSLASGGELGPRFEDLALRGIIYSPAPGESVVLLADARGKIYRVRQGAVVGNSRVLEIGRLRVLFAVENFGIVRQELLELKRKPLEGIKG
ncbi:MAG: hypothetical protein HY561_01575 [Gemmatimonadetes bacterium]|nr:hypothetical protein [Gemmatimonadota bacterium]